MSPWHCDTVTAAGPNFDKGFRKPLMQNLIFLLSGWILPQFSNCSLWNLIKSENDNSFWPAVLEARNKTFDRGTIYKKCNFLQSLPSDITYRIPSLSAFQFEAEKQM